VVVIVLGVSGWSFLPSRSVRTCASPTQASSALPIDVTCAGTREPTRISRLTVHRLAGMRFRRCGELHHSQPER
jgi:hypothetical protein